MTDFQSMPQHNAILPAGQAAPDASGAAAQNAAPIRRPLTRYRNRAVLLACMFLGVAIAYYGSRAFNVPAFVEYQGSLLQQPSWIFALAGTAIIYLLAVAAATALGSGVRFNAGLLAGGLALATLSARSGSAQQLMFWGFSHSDGSAGFFFELIGELMLLGGLVGAAWLSLWAWHDAGRLGDAHDIMPNALEENRRAVAWALLSQFAINVLLILCLAVSPAKAQVTAAIALAGFVSTGVSDCLFGSSASARWSFISPVAAGVLGYAACLINPAGLDTGHLQSLFAPLARGLPLDYAGVGSAGALLGLWSGSPLMRSIAELFVSPNAAVRP